MKWLALIPFLGLAACAANPQDYAAEKPTMDFITYFSGTTYGAGAIYSRSGKITNRFAVTMQGTPGKNPHGQRTLHIAEDFTYTSGKTQKRSWDVTETAPNQLVGLAPDVPGKAVGVQAGNAVHFSYPLTITRENGKQITLTSSDWMWMMPPAGKGVAPSVLNRNTLSKFGVNVAELVLTMSKSPL